MYTYKIHLHKEEEGGYTVMGACFAGVHYLWRKCGCGNNYGKRSHLTLY